MRESIMSKTYGKVTDSCEIQVLTNDGIELIVACHPNQVKRYMRRLLNQPEYVRAIAILVDGYKTKVFNDCGKFIGSTWEENWNILV